MSATVVAVSRSPTYTFTKPEAAVIKLIAGHGVEATCTPA